MRKLTVFNAISLDGYFTDETSDMSWAHKTDPEWMDFSTKNAGGEAVLVFGRVTYDLMVKYWPTPQAKKDAPGVAEGMNRLQKIVFSKTLDKATWENTTVIKGDIVAETHRLKEQKGPDLLILGSGTIVSQLTDAGLIDEYQIIVNSLVLGAGRTMFDGVKQRVDLKLRATRSFKNGNVVLSYERA